MKRNLKWKGDDGFPTTWVTMMTLGDTRVLMGDGEGSTGPIALDINGKTAPEDRPADLVLLNSNNPIELNADGTATIPCTRRTTEDDPQDDEKQFVAEDPIGFRVSATQAIWIANFFRMAVATPYGPVRVGSLGPSDNYRRRDYAGMSGGDKPRDR